MKNLLDKILGLLIIGLIPFGLIYIIFMGIDSASQFEGWKLLITVLSIMAVGIILYFVVSRSKQAIHTDKLMKEFGNEEGCPPEYLEEKRYKGVR